MQYNVKSNRSGKQFKPMIEMIQGNWWIPDKIKYRFPKAADFSPEFKKTKSDEAQPNRPQQIGAIMKAGAAYSQGCTRPACAIAFTVTFNIILHMEK